jgi:hypothetical protein
MTDEQQEQAHRVYLDSLQERDWEIERDLTIELPEDHREEDDVALGRDSSIG